jgi:hypothetical protein
MNITKFDKPTLKMVREAIQSSLDGLQVDLGIQLKIGTMRFDDSTFTTKLEASLFGHDPLAEEWEKYANRFGLDATWIGKKFHYIGKTYTIVGLDTKKRKYPVMTACDGKKYKFPADIVVKRMSIVERMSA